jgi:hypothetical protein
MATKLELLLEAEKRGLLPPEKKAALDEARKRGLVDDPNYLHPDDISPGDVTVIGPDGRIEAANPMAQGAPAPVETPAPVAAPKAPPATPDEWSSPALVPFQHNRKTGQWRPAVPGIVQGAMDAAALPGDVLGGKYPELDPANGMQGLSPALIGRGLGFAGTFAGGGSLPKVAQGPLKTLGAGAADQFGIPLTRGQALGDLPMLTKEETLRQGGGTASNIMRNFDAAQREKIVGVADDIGLKLGRNPESMPDLVTTAVRDKVAFHKEQAASLYQIGADGGASIAPEMVQALPQIVDQSLKGSAVTVDANLTPGASVAMRLISEASDMAGALTPAAGKGAAGSAPADIKGVSLDAIEQLRKQIVGLGQGANDTDGRALKAIKRAVDDWEQTAVDNMLVSGDDKALEAIKAARKSSGEYLRITNPETGDAAGAAVAKMQKGDATAEEVANWLYGADVANPTLQAPKVAARIKELVGADSPAWSAVRSSAWERLVKDPRSATGEALSNTMIAKRIETFLNAKGQTLSKELYSDEERAAMQSYADALKATVTPREATNPSRTAYTVKGTLDAITRMIVGASATATAGPGVGAAAYLAVPVFKNIGSRTAARRAVGQLPEKTTGPITLGAPLGAAKGELTYLGGVGVNDNGMSPAIKKPGGTMTLNEWVNQQNAMGKMAV